MKYSDKPISKYEKRKIIFCFFLDLIVTQTALMLHINRKTINKYFNVFRRKIFDYQLNKLKKFAGEVEVDESCLGPRRIKGEANEQGRGTTFKQLMSGIYKRQGWVYPKIITDCKAKTLRETIIEKIDPKSVIYSDPWRGYSDLVGVGY